MLEFSNTWFERDARPIWDSLIPSLKPGKVLEVGSYEGASACYLIRSLGNDLDLEIVCVDSWAGGVEHDSLGMAAVESRFDSNTRTAIDSVSRKVNLKKLKSDSFSALCNLTSEGKKSYFDFVYIDGSHQAPDVLSDAVLSFQLLRSGGVLVFDDYLWQEKLPGGVDPLRCPKPAIDAFINIYVRQLRILRGPLYQVYIQKTI